MNFTSKIAPFFLCFVLMMFTSAQSAILEVGEDKPFRTIEDAVLQAKKGDFITIFPLPDGQPYRQTAVLIQTPNLTLRSCDPHIAIVLDGTDFEYSGIGTVPRAIFQFDPGAHGCHVQGLTFVNAHNQTHNGAGIRINGANDVIIRNCVFHSNDMGIMSNGDYAARSGARQLIEKCHIFNNGNEQDPGYNHNLYLGGTSVTVRDCTIECSLTGHNVTSRAYINCLVNNIIRHAANRELDLVDADGNTTIPESDAFLVGNTIIKNPECQGNRTVIHFGEDAGTIRSGTVWLIDNVISTPFLSPVLEITSGRGAIFLENTFDNDDADREGTLALLHDPGMKICGRTNTFPPKFLIRKTFENEPSPVSFDEIPELPKFLEILVDRYRRERSKK